MIIISYWKPYKFFAKKQKPNQTKTKQKKMTQQGLTCHKPTL